MFSLIDVFPIKSHIKDILKLHGLKTDKDVLAYAEEELMQLTALNEQEIDHVLSILRSPNPTSHVPTESALKVLEDNSFKIPIPSLSTSLDEMLEGGFQTGKMYQFYGEPGSAKTQLCLQLCCTVQMPVQLSGYQASAIYIDTESSFKSERFVEIAHATIERIEKLADTQDKNLSIKNMVENLFIFKCEEPQHLTTIVFHQLEDEIIEKKPKLIVLDNIAYQFRYGNDDFVCSKRKDLIRISQKLRYLAFKYDVCVICVNQISFDLKNQQIVPSLGYYWNHSPFGHLRFSRVSTGIRSIQGEKGCYKKDRIYFRIEKNGIRDLDDLDENLEQLEIKSHEHEEELQLIFTQDAELLKEQCR